MPRLLLTGLTLSVLVSCGDKEPAPAPEDSGEVEGDADADSDADSDTDADADADPDLGPPLSFRGEMAYKDFDYDDGDCVVAWTFTTEANTEDYCPDCVWQFVMNRAVDTSLTTCDEDSYYGGDVWFGKMVIENDLGPFHYVVGGPADDGADPDGYSWYLYYSNTDTAFLDKGMPDLADNWPYPSPEMFVRDSTRLRIGISHRNLIEGSSTNMRFGEITYAYGELY